MTATQTPCTPEADRFQCLIKTPDPPVQPAARKRYWDDTVMEAVGELRRRLGSSRESVVTMALLSVLEVEKTRMRTGRPVSGTHVSHTREDDGSLPKLGPLEVDTPVVVVARSASERCERPLAERATTAPSAAVPTPQVSEPITPVVAAAVSSTRERGPLAVADPPRPSPDDPPPGWPTPSGSRSASLPEGANHPDPSADPAFRAVLVADRAAYLELTGTYPEDDFPDWAVWATFKADPRPHPAELRWRERQAGTLPVGIT